MQENIQKVYECFIQYGLNVLGAIIIFIVGRLVAKVVADLVRASLLKAHVDRTLASFVWHLVFYGVITFACLAALNKLGVETTSFIAVIGAASLAVGLALQGSLANFASGVMLILFRPFKVGDTIDAGGAQGQVQDIQIFNTVILTADKKTVIVPNSKITGDKITIDPHTS